MGHCKPAPAEAKKDPLVPASAPEVKVRKQPVCAPEHAAMGHCTPAPDTQEGDEDIVNRHRLFVFAFADGEQEDNVGGFVAPLDADDHDAWHGLLPRGGSLVGR